MVTAKEIPGRSYNYKCLKDRLKNLNLLYEENKDMKYLVEEDCIIHLFECESLKVYEKIAEHAIKLGVHRVIDIGCAYGHQSEVFLQDEIKYVGVTDDTKKGFWNEDKFEYIYIINIHVLYQ